MKAYFTIALSIVIAVTAKAKFLSPAISPNRFLNDASTRIVGGRLALQGEVPFQLSLYLDEHFYCGASLVEVDDIQIGITAGHCTLSITNPFKLVAGDINLADDTGIEQIRPVQKIIRHQNYTGAVLRNDIALLFFNRSFELNENVKTIPLPIQNQVTSGGSLTVSGWGALEFLGGSSNDLQIVEIPLVNDTYCQEAYQDYFLTVTDDMICAGRTAGDISTCHGDSGGPAISDAGYLAGVVSWSYQCGHPKYPAAVFTKVSHYIDWIHTEVNNYKRTL